MCTAERFCSAPNSGRSGCSPQHVLLGGRVRYTVGWLQVRPGSTASRASTSCASIPATKRSMFVTSGLECCLVGFGALRTRAAQQGPALPRGLRAAGSSSCCLTVACRKLCLRLGCGSLPRTLLVSCPWCERMKAASPPEDPCRPSGTQASGAAGESPAGRSQRQLSSRRSESVSSRALLTRGTPSAMRTDRGVRAGHGHCLCSPLRALA